MADSTPSTSAVGEISTIESLVLDAGPLLSRTSLRGLAKKYYMPPQVLAELRDQRAREHFEWLRGPGGGLLDIEIREASPQSMVEMIAFAKKTGDYSVLSKPDLNVLALTYSLEVERHGHWRIRDELRGKTGQQKFEEDRKKNGKVKESSQSTWKTSDVSNGKAQGLPQEAWKGSAQDTREDEALVGRLESAATKLSLDAESSPDEFEDVKEDIVSDSRGNVSQEEALDEANDGFPSPGKALLANMQDATVPKQEPKHVVALDRGKDEEDDDEDGGEWITPDNVVKHKNRSLGLVTDEDMPPTISSSNGAKASHGRSGKATVTEDDDGWSTVTTKKPDQTSGMKELQSYKVKRPKNPGKLTVACMTGDYAIQNVLLQMGLSLVGVEGQRIKQVKSWVLRCHACFKICKDSERKFCPQCGNPTLLRTSVTSTSPDAAKGSHVNPQGLQVHLKKNFQYKNRGTIYSLPLPKAGKAGGKAEAVPILREDQLEWQRAVQRDKTQKAKEERKLQKALEKGKDSLSARYDDADELSMLLAGGTGKTRGQDFSLPELGVGRKNPNERRRRKV